MRDATVSRQARGVCVLVGGEPALHRAFIIANVFDRFTPDDDKVNIDLHNKYHMTTELPNTTWVELFLETDSVCQELHLSVCDMI